MIIGPRAASGCSITRSSCFVRPNRVGLWRLQSRRCRLIGPIGDCMSRSPTRSPITVPTDKQRSTRGGSGNGGGWGVDDTTRNFAPACRWKFHVIAEGHLGPILDEAAYVEAAWQRHHPLIQARPGPLSGRARPGRAGLAIRASGKTGDPARWSTPFSCRRRAPVPDRCRPSALPTR